MVFHEDLEAASPVLFIVSVLAIQILCISAMVLTGIWMKHYLGGFAWDGSGHEFDYHPLCMVISLVFLYSEGKIFICFLILRSLIHTPNMFISRSRHLELGVGSYFNIERLSRFCRFIFDFGMALI